MNRFFDHTNGLELKTLVHHGGDVLLDPQVSANKPGSMNGQDSTLTVRELEVLQLIVDGKSDRQIASQLGLSRNTVNVHRANIMKTLGTHKTAQLVVYAIRKGLVDIRQIGYSQTESLAWRSSQNEEVAAHDLKAQ